MDDIHNYFKLYLSLLNLKNKIISIITAKCHKAIVAAIFKIEVLKEKYKNYPVQNGL